MGLLIYVGELLGNEKSWANSVRLLVAVQLLSKLVFVANLQNVLQCRENPAPDNSWKKTYERIDESGVD